MGDENLIRRHNEVVLSNLQPGDLVEFPRGVFSHWAVYIGNEEVVHLAGVGEGISNASVTSSASLFSIAGILFNKAKVCMDNYWNVAAGSMAHINNRKDGIWSALSPEEIVEKALAKLEDVGYNLLSSNCEHFAKWCRYGISHSDQVEEVVEDVTTAVGITWGAVCVIGGAALLYYAITNNNESAKKKK